MCDYLKPQIQIFGKERERAITHHLGVAKERFAGLVGMLMMKGDAFDENKLLSLVRAIVQSSGLFQNH